MYVTATKQKGNPDIVRGVDFARYVDWVLTPPNSYVLFTLNFSAN